MKKIYLLFSICFLLFLQGKAQDMEWVQTGVNTGEAYVVDFFTDQNDTLYVLGQFENTLDIGSVQLTSEGGLDNYVAKYDPDGNLIWAFSLGNTGPDIPADIVVKDDGSFIVSGLYQNTVNIGTLSMTSSGSYDAFVMSFAADGTPLSVIENKGTSVVGMAGTDITSNGDYIVSGIFLGDVDLNGQQTLTSTGASFDTYIARYQSDGTLVYAIQLEDSERITPGAGLYLDDNDNIFVAGEFRSNVIFDGVQILSGNNPGSSVDSKDIYVAKFDGNGNFLWAQKGGGVLEDQPYDLKADSNGNVYVVGRILGPGDFGTINIAGTQGFDSFVAKYSAEGTPLWVDRSGANSASNDRALSIDLDDNNQVLYITGRNEGVISFGDYNLTHQDGDLADVYLVKYDYDGTAMSARQYTGTGFQQGTAVSVSSSGVVYLGMEVDGTVNIESVSYNSTETATADAFFLKLRDCELFPLSVSLVADKEGICSGDMVNITANVENLGNNPFIEWSINDQVVQSSGLTLSVDTLTQESVVSLRLIREAYCREIVSPAPVTIKVDDFTVGVQISSDQVAPVCEGIAITFSSDVIGGGDAPAYQWKINNTAVSGATEATFTSDQITAGDVVTLDVTSSLPCVPEPNATSNAIFPDVYPFLGVSIDPNDAVGCETSDMLLTATLNGDYGAVSYVWLKNSEVIVDETSPTLIVNSPVDQDIYEVQVTGENVCYEGGASVATSTVTLQVAQAVTPTVVINADATTVEEGQTVTFTATTTNEGSEGVITWYVGGLTTEQTGTTFASDTLSDQAVVTAILVSSLECVTASEVESDPVIITVNPVTGIDLVDINEETKFYPNPLQSVSVLEFPNDQREAFAFTLTDLSGRIVRSVSEIKTNSVTIEKGNLEPGIYLYRLSSETRVSSGRIAVD